MTATPFPNRGGARPPRPCGALPSWPSLNVPLALYEAWRFELGVCRQALLEHLDVVTLAGFGCDDLPLAVRAAGVIVAVSARSISPPRWRNCAASAPTRSTAFMTLDLATRRDLELTETLRDRAVHGSLLGVLDRTLTPMGGRLLRRWLGEPLLDRLALGRTPGGRGSLLRRPGRTHRGCAACSTWATSSG